MINDIRTKEIYGYSFVDLKTNSCKPVIWHCNSCGTEKIKKYINAKKANNCIICSNKINANKNKELRISKIKEWYQKNEHPLKNTKRPNHVLEALKKANTARKRNEKEIAALKERTKGSKNPFYGKTHSQESINKIQANRKKIVGADCNFYGKIYHPKRKNNFYKDARDREFYFRSSWELKVASYLDTLSITWDYEPKAFQLTVGNKQCTYTPDFYLLKEDKYIEVKGYWREDAINKFIKFKEEYSSINIEVWDKNHLKKLNIKL